MDCEFKRVEVMHITKGGTLVCWELARAFYPVGPLHFFVDFAWPGSDEWTVLNTEPIVDDCCFIDTCQRNHKILNEATYRVRLVLPGAEGCPTFRSQPTSALGSLSHKDWLRARDIVRREHLQQRKVDGSEGILLKRKKFGVACPVCQDWDTGEVTNSSCTTCFGTGIVGGYYPGIPFYITEYAGYQRRIAVAGAKRGTFSELTDDDSRCVLYPMLDTRDVWVSGDSDARYIIDKVKILVEYKGLPLIGTLKISLAPGSHIIYSVPLEKVLSSSSESSSSEVCDATKGLVVDDGDFDW